MNTQFEVPTHPLCVALSEDHINRGKAAISSCREMFQRAIKVKPSAANVRMASKEIKKYGLNSINASEAIAAEAEQRHKEQLLEAGLKNRGLEYVA